jgi:broad specificity phosphatase PhoE
MKIYLIRHGETTGDLENKYGGAYDDHLTKKGRADAVLLAEKLSDKGIQIIYSSPKLRTKESSEILNEKLNVPLHVIDGLQERDYGILGGMDKNEAKEKYPEVVEKHKDIYNTDPEGESYEEFKNRVLNVFETLTNDNQYTTIAIFSHGGPIKLIYRELFKQGELDELDDYGVLELEKDDTLKFIALHRLGK